MLRKPQQNILYLRSSVEPSSRLSRKEEQRAGGKMFPRRPAEQKQQACSEPLLLLSESCWTSCPRAFNEVTCLSPPWRVNHDGSESVRQEDSVREQRKRTAGPQLTFSFFSPGSQPMELRWFLANPHHTWPLSLLYIGSLVSGTKLSISQLLHLQMCTTMPGLAFFLLLLKRNLNRWLFGS